MVDQAGTFSDEFTTTVGAVCDWWCLEFQPGSFFLRSIQRNVDQSRGAETVRSGQRFGISASLFSSREFSALCTYKFLVRCYTVRFVLFKFRFHLRSKSNNSPSDIITGILSSS